MDEVREFSRTENAYAMRVTAPSFVGMVDDSEFTLRVRKLSIFTRAPSWEGTGPEN